MTRIPEGTRITLKSVLYLTHFSEASEAALLFAVAIASDYGARVYVLHVLTPVIPETCLEAIRADEKFANTELAKDTRAGSSEHWWGSACCLAALPASCFR